MASPEPSSGSATTNSSESVGPQVAILFIGVSMCLGVVCRQLLKGTRVPYTVALLLLGIAIGGLGSCLSSPSHSGNGLVIAIVMFTMEPRMVSIFEHSVQSHRHTCRCSSVRSYLEPCHRPIYLGAKLRRVST